MQPQQSWQTSLYKCSQCSHTDQERPGHHVDIQLHPCSKPCILQTEQEQFWQQAAPKGPAKRTANFAANAIHCDMLIFWAWKCRASLNLTHDLTFITWRSKCTYMIQVEWICIILQATKATPIKKLPSRPLEWCHHATMQLAHLHWVIWLLHNKSASMWSKYASTVQSPTSHVQL